SPRHLCRNWCQSNNGGVANFEKPTEDFKLGRSHHRDMMYGGVCAAFVAWLTETSVLDPEEGIRFQVPQQRHVAVNQRRVANAGGRAGSQQFACAIAAMNTAEPLRLRPTLRALPKTKYWELGVRGQHGPSIAKLPTVAAIIYKNLYRDGAHPLSHRTPNWIERGLHRAHAPLPDHPLRSRGRNVSAHATPLGWQAHSATLTCPSPLECAVWPPAARASPIKKCWSGLTRMVAEIGNSPSDDKVKEYVWKTLQSGQRVPGFGHALYCARLTRATCARESLRSSILPNDPMFKPDLQRSYAEILLEQGKVKNPWPNVDALWFYGMKEMNYYTVLFGSQQSLWGVLASLVWDEPSVCQSSGPRVSQPTSSWRWLRRLKSEHNCQFDFESGAHQCRTVYEPSPLSLLCVRQMYTRDIVHIGAASSEAEMHCALLCSQESLVSKAFTMAEGSISCSSLTVRQFLTAAAPAAVVMVASPTRPGPRSLCPPGYSTDLCGMKYRVYVGNGRLDGKQAKMRAEPGDMTTWPKLDWICPARSGCKIHQQHQPEDGLLAGRISAARKPRAVWRLAVDRMQPVFGRFLWGSGQPNNVLGGNQNSMALIDGMLNDLAEDYTTVTAVLCQCFSPSISAASYEQQSRTGFNQMQHPCLCCIIDSAISTSSRSFSRIEFDRSKLNPCGPLASGRDGRVSSGDLRRHRLDRPEPVWSGVSLRADPGTDVDTP
uniref:Citrate synthase n=1 Tax=Macrostomum lignano TaxID=282301 RepID=A0A1I8FJ69_9PLAT